MELTEEPEARWPLDKAALLEVLETVRAGGSEERVRTAAQTTYQALIDAELTSVIGAGPWERSADRTAQRNGSRPRTLTTTAGDWVFIRRRCGTGSVRPRFTAASGRAPRPTTQPDGPNSSVKSASDVGPTRS